jgi:hypothetical protein
MSSMDRPERSQAYRVIVDTLQEVKRRLGVTEQNAFSPLATELINKWYPQKKNSEKASA